MSGTSSTVTFTTGAPATATITNVAPYAETFTLGVGQYDAAASYPRREAFLQPGESFTQDVTFSVPEGGYGVVIGPAGSGKTTLLELITGEQLPDDGRIDDAL